MRIIIISLSVILAFNLVMAGKTSSRFRAGGTKGNWYQPPPAQVVEQEPIEQVQAEQQVEYGAAPAGQAEPFAFDFKTRDDNGNGQYRREEGDANGAVRGSYGYTDANGIYRHVEYIADQNGFRANIKSNEPGVEAGKTVPASVQLAASGQPAQRQLSPSNINNQRISAPSAIRNEPDQSGDWSSNSGNNLEPAILAPNFESAHRSDRIVRAPRHFRN